MDICVFLFYLCYITLVNVLKLKVMQWVSYNLEMHLIFLVNSVKNLLVTVAFFQKFPPISLCLCNFPGSNTVLVLLLTRVWKGPFIHLHAWKREKCCIWKVILSGIFYRFDSSDYQLEIVVHLLCFTLFRNWLNANHEMKTLNLYFDSFEKV